MAKITALKSELAMLRKAVTERDWLLQEVRELHSEILPLREQVARLTASGEHQAIQIRETCRAERSAGREPLAAGRIADAGPNRVKNAVRRQHDTYNQTPYPRLSQCPGARRRYSIK